MWTKTSIKGSFVNNTNVDWTIFALPMRYDYRLVRGVGLEGKFVQPLDVNGIRLTSKFEYVHSLATRALTAKASVQSALQGMGSGKWLDSRGQPDL